VIASFVCQGGPLISALPGHHKRKAGSFKLSQLRSSELFIGRYGARVVLVSALLTFVLPSAATAQASPYVPLDDVAYTYIDGLMARGAFRELSVLERPYTERALRVAIDSARSREPGPVIASYLDELCRPGEG